MEKYDYDEECTVWFIVYDHNGFKRIQAYSDNKDYVDTYMAFHKCKYMKVKKMCDTARKVFEVLEDCVNDEIGFYNIIVRSDKKKQRPIDYIYLPMTHSEATVMNDEYTNYMATRIDYSLLNEAMYYLKDKYFDALKGILLKHVIDLTVYNHASPLITSIDLDQATLLLKSQPDLFG